MALRTAEQYMQSLRDGREIYFDGERVQDVVTHPKLQAAFQTSVMYYLLENDPLYRDFMTTKNEQGDDVPFIFLPARTSADMVRKREIVVFLARTGLGIATGGSYVGCDALNALTVVSRKMDREIETKYSERVEAFRQHLLKNDLMVVGAITDAKGDRSLRPADQKPHQDYYVRVVGETKEGIVVRGAKWHISRSPMSNELFVCPTRTMREEDKDFAVSFAIPVNTPGIKLICGSREPIEEGDLNEYPLTAAHFTAEALIVFDDVLVPWERVFLNKEWRYSGQIAHMFGNFHRLYADTYKYVELEILAGVAALLAEYNGIEKAEHIRDKLSWLAFYLETVGALGRAACDYPVIEKETGLPYPNPMYSNAAKLFFADNYHQAVKCVQDIGGGILADVPSFKNFLSPATRPYVEKYLQGKAGVPTEHRLRAVMLARDACAAYTQATTIHAEGSLATQRKSIYGAADWARYKAMAKRAALIEDDKAPQIVKDLPSFPPDLRALGLT